ncbi:uncharacterized protein, PH0010 family/AmmeMemoRadiSam system protein A/AmmeMemoRadiSam system protein B [Tindallia californiensis]|uniref:Uncharacterized protein, PH0010 family/AmmeMemoRadiSam system protein A/AmmeMemoRadiSam system protein B n=2 Tax=Tindallia californiensis TaxID=159292 RepID=A0A1H3JMX8_9FIRM|nr:uncharacterized protein, PH0010 family/AmmeMemoRadiSam system protein A/AmmeMemoRadiSam system protein B [Tindallia californiensis]
MMSPVIGVSYLPHPPIIVPEVGKEKAEDASQTIEGVRRVVRCTAEKKPETIVVLTPHAQQNCVFSIASNQQWHADLSRFGCPEAKLFLKNNTDLVDKITSRIGLSRLEMDLDHGAFVPLYYMSKEMEDLKIVLIGVGPYPLDTITSIASSLGNLLNQYNENMVLLASGDLSHRLKSDGPYGLHPSGAIFDEMVVNAFKSNRLDRLKKINGMTREEAAECGLNPFIVANEITKNHIENIQLFSYEAPFGVGYLTAFANCKTVSKHPYVKLAAESIKQYVENRKMLDSTKYLSFLMDEKALKKERERRAGTFVSIYKNNILRGCIGTIMPSYENLPLEISQNAIAAATEDPRFLPIEVEELEDITIKVDVLGEMESVQKMSDLDPKIYGVMVVSSHKKGVLLPDLEGVEKVEQQLDIAKKKAGISKEETMKIYRFKVTRFN